ncbi:uncharacterized protein isoform X2 [Takifugu rubripes]|uniref:uncharacterized protein isoform X2 n=1 Tax=Takifugu rubripes TaxID=31033 RepID=UPI001145208C|nr:uncharacterized protein LOC105416444 isoform X2 [Takifugu rubripes]
MTSHARVEPSKLFSSRNGRQNLTNWSPVICGMKGVFPVCSTYRPTMKIILFVIYAGFVLPVHSDERHAYCESCLATAKAIEKEMKDVPAEERQRVVEKLISGDVCENLLTYKQVPEDKIKSSCMDLLGSHYEQIHSALLSQELKRLDIVLCYEQSTACVGVKHLSFEDARKRTFAESDIEALLQDNKENVRFAQPVHAELPDHPKEEL